MRALPKRRLLNAALLFMMSRNLSVVYGRTSWATPTLPWPRGSSRIYWRAAVLHPTISTLLFLRSTYHLVTLSSCVVRMI